MVVPSCPLHWEDKQFPAQTARAQLAAGAAAPAPGPAGGIGGEFLGDSGGQSTMGRWASSVPQNLLGWWLLQGTPAVPTDHSVPGTCASPSHSPRPWPSRHPRARSCAQSRNATQNLRTVRLRFISLLKEPSTFPPASLIHRKVEREQRLAGSSQASPEAGAGTHGRKAARAAGPADHAWALRPLPVHGEENTVKSTLGPRPTTASGTNRKTVATWRPDTQSPDAQICKFHLTRPDPVRQWAPPDLRLSHPRFVLPVSLDCFLLYLAFFSCISSGFFLCFREEGPRWGGVHGGLRFLDPGLVPCSSGWSQRLGGPTCKRTE